MQAGEGTGSDSRGLGGHAGTDSERTTDSGPIHSQCSAIVPTVRAVAERHHSP